MRLTSIGYEAKGYDPSERAYRIEKTAANDSAACTFILDASEDSPLLNPAILIKNWGRLLATLKVNGNVLPPGEDFRQGIRRGPLGDDLVIWVALDAREPVEITVGRVQGK